ncbi:MAG TPA: hypothetical protein VJ771_08595 [Candidatus Nitrosotalea sp.]|nr:hypothetical protein [Candidatus Nitrosotalea sp.]
MKTLPIAIIVISGIIMVVVSFPVALALGYDSIAKTSSWSPPLKQLKEGIIAQDVKCNGGFQLIIKSEDGSPACVSPENVASLVERGWAKQAFYYHDAHVKPKITLNDYNYTGIDDEGNTTVSINNQTYYQTTINYSAYNLPKALPIQFQNVTFIFPAGSMLTPGGAFVMLDLKFPDSFEEIYGIHTENEMGGIPVPTQYGPHLAVNSTTVLSNHMEPQAGMTIYHDKIKLLVSADANPILQTKADNSSSLKLYFSTESQSIRPGQAIGITVSVNNTLPTQLHVKAANSGALSSLSLEPCIPRPFGIAMFQGFYSKENMTYGKSLLLFNPDALCPVMNATQDYVFEPSSARAVAYTCTDAGQPLCSYHDEIADHVSITGYWYQGQLYPFKPGMYTVIGGDEWGHVAIEHFVVSNSTIFAGELGSMSCPAMPDGVQFGATIKNSTGFANYYNSTQYGNTFFLHPGMMGTITVQYSAPANVAWFQNNGNAPFNMTDGISLIYMANVTEGKSKVSYAASLYNDTTGHHSQICHYGMPFGGFEEPCDTDNTGDIPLGELPYASKLLHVGIETSFDPSSVMLYPDSNPVFTAKVSATPDAMPGVYWMSLGRSLCGPGVLAKLVVLP